MKQFIKWLGGFFEDQKHSASSKRLAFYATIYFFYMQVYASINDKLPNEEINKYVLYGTIILLLFQLGAITSEFFNRINLPLMKETKTENKTENIETKVETKIDKID